MIVQTREYVYLNVYVLGNNEACYNGTLKNSAQPADSMFVQSVHPIQNLR